MCRLEGNGVVDAAVEVDIHLDSICELAHVLGRMKAVR
jgi:hypothetical protein